MSKGSSFLVSPLALTCTILAGLTGLVWGFAIGWGHLAADSFVLAKLAMGLVVALPGVVVGYLSGLLTAGLLNMIGGAYLFELIVEGIFALFAAIFD